MCVISAGKKCTKNSMKERRKAMAKKSKTSRIQSKLVMIEKLALHGITSEEQIKNLTPKEALSMEDMSFDDILNAFNEAYKEFINKNFLVAGKLFLQANAILPEDNLSIFFAERCKRFIEKGVSENWDGIVDMTNK